MGFSLWGFVLARIKPLKKLVFARSKPQQAEACATKTGPSTLAAKPGKR
jgi:hypothetical protein